MVNITQCGTLAESGVSHACQIGRFNSLYGSTIEHDDANGMLLNEAVRLRTNDNSFPDPWSESNDDEQGVSAVFRQKSEELEESRKRFLKYLNEDQKTRISKSANTTQAVLNIIDTANYDWCKRSESGNATATWFKKKFHQVCKSLDQHKDLFSILPKDSEYVSVFYGAFNTIIAASVMHQAMATGLPKIVDELNAIINDVAQKMKLYPEASQEMKRVVMGLYSRIFDLLAKLMKWYTKRHRGLKIMKKDCYSDFEHALRDIRNWVDVVTKGAWNNFVLEMRHANEENRDARKDILKIAESYYDLKDNPVMQQATQQAQTKLLSPEAHIDSLADALVNRFFKRVEEAGAGQAYILASSMAVNTVQSPGTRPAPRMLASLSSPASENITVHQTFATNMYDEPTSLSPNMDDQPNTAGIQTKEELEHISQVLDKYYPEGHLLPVQYSQTPTSRPTLHESIASRLFQWSKSPESRVLCIQLPYDQQQRSIGGKIAANVVLSAYDVDYPIISYFCTLPRDVAEGRSAQTTALCEMTACLIRQLVMALPDSLPERSSVVLTAARFENLDGTLRTWNSMLSLFADLLSLIPTGMLIVIHGMQCLNSEHTTVPIQEFLSVIRQRLDNKDDTAGHTTKILFVMEGQARAVVPWLQRGEHALYDGDRRLSR